MINLHNLMNSKTTIVTIGTWFIFMILAIINAGIRNEVYKPVVGDLVAHQISTIIFIILILVVTFLVLKISKIKLNNFQTIIMGTIWLVLTIMYEFIAGHFVFGNSFDKLFADYNILNGRVWSFVLVITFFAPYISNKLLRRLEK